MADAQAGNDEAVVDILDVVLVDDVWDSAAPPVERYRGQMKQLHEQGQVLIEEHFPEWLGFLVQMELLQTVGFPGPLEPAQGMASGSALPASQAKVHQELQYHSHQ